MRHFIYLYIPVLVLVGFDIQNCFAGSGWSYEQFVQRHDTDGDGQVTREEFRGAQKNFRRLDRNGNHKVTKIEFEQTQQNRRHHNKNQKPSDKMGTRHRNARQLPSSVEIRRDLEYASVDGESLLLDLYLPEKTEIRPPLLVWIHGGGWARGDKTKINPAIIRLSSEGYAVASINYRLGGLHLHPKQIHDCKGAIRWLRANAKKYGYDATRIGAGGGSAGGHLALLLGLSGSVKELEGNVGGNLNESSRIQAIVDMFGPSALQDYANESPKFRHNKSPTLLRSASPIQYLSKDDPPLLIFHGDKDKIVPVSQSRILHKRYQQASLDSALHIIEDATHGGMEFSDQNRYLMIKEFFDKHTKKNTKEHRGVKVPDVSVQKKESESITSDRQNHILDQQATRPHGFHWMIGPKSGLEGSEIRFQRLLDEIERNLSTNPHITGVYIISHWNLIEPEEGQFDFNRLDRVIESIRKKGRYYKLAIAPGIYSPNWVYDKGVDAFKTTGSNPARKKIYQKNIKIPVPWDPGFLNSYFKIMGKVADRYGDDEYFRAITLTVATFMSPEWHLPHSIKDKKQWHRLAGFPHKLEQVWKEGIDRFADLFPQQYLILEASSYPIGLKDLGDAVVHHGVTKYAGRFAVQINQLSGRFDQSNRPTYQKLLEYRKKYGTQILIGLQNVKGWGFQKIREQQGSMEMTAFNFQQAEGEYWELWYHDGKTRETCETLQSLKQEGSRLGLASFKQKLIADSKYKPIVKIQNRLK